MLSTCLGPLSWLLSQQVRWSTAKMLVMHKVTRVQSQNPGQGQNMLAGKMRHM